MNLHHLYISLGGWIKQPPTFDGLLSQCERCIAVFGVLWAVFVWIGMAAHDGDTRIEARQGVYEYLVFPHAWCTLRLTLGLLQFAASFTRKWTARYVLSAASTATTAAVLGLFAGGEPTSAGVGIYLALFTLCVSVHWFIGRRCFYGTPTS